MNNEVLDGVKIAILATEGFEEVELAEPRKALDKAGAETALIAPKEEYITAWDHTHWSDQYDVDVHLDNADPIDYDALFLPGGVLNPDKLRTIDKAVEFSAQFMLDEKPVAAICHGPQTLIETGELEGRTMTSYNAIKTDLKNAGVEWVDQEVVVDGNLITSRNPDDIPAFINQIVEEFQVVAESKMTTN